MVGKDLSPQAGAATDSEVRVSRADRDRVAQVLSAAAAEERLSLDEMKWRLDAVYAAETKADLASAIGDLPTPVEPDERIGGAPGSRVSVGTMSLAKRTGPWVVPAVHTSVAVWGGTQLDLSQARFAQRETVIRAFVYLGAVEVIVPEDIVVHLEGVGFLGSFYGDPPEGGAPGCPVVRITGVAIWGTVRITRSTGRSPEQLDAPSAE